MSDSIGRLVTYATQCGKFLHPIEFRPPALNAWIKFIVTGIQQNDSDDIFKGIMVNYRVEKSGYFKKLKNVFREFICKHEIICIICI